MKSLALKVSFFFLGVLFTLLSLQVFKAEPYDLHVFRGSTYEIWIETAAAYPAIPMSPFRYTVKHREICSDSGNICSPWKTVASFIMDDPYSAGHWNLKEEGSSLELEFPENIQVIKTETGWVTQGAR